MAPKGSVLTPICHHVDYTVTAKQASSTSTPLNAAPNRRKLAEIGYLQMADTEPVTSRLSQVLLGAIWAISGVMMAVNPPPSGSRRAAALPMVGWVVLVGGIYVAVKAIRAHELQDSGHPPRHASGAEASARGAIKFVAASTVGALAGVGALWWGVSSGLLSVLGLGTAALGMSLLAMPQAVSALAWLLRREKS